jgi:hypothetical protein
MEQKLIGFSIYSSAPEELKRFLSEVLSLEIDSGPGLFRVKLGELFIDIFAGDSLPTMFQWELSLESWYDLAARWEFFCFRYAECQPTREILPIGLRFTTTDGHMWFVNSPQSISPNENPSISVRNC